MSAEATPRPWPTAPAAASTGGAARAWSPGLDTLLAALAGGLHALSFAPREAGWLQLACVAWLFARLAAAPPSRRSGAC